MAVDMKCNSELYRDKDSGEDEALEYRPGQLNRRAAPITTAECEPGTCPPKL